MSVLHVKATSLSLLSSIGAEGLKVDVLLD